MRRVYEKTPCEAAILQDRDSSDGRGRCNAQFLSAGGAGHTSLFRDHPYVRLSAWGLVEEREGVHEDRGGESMGLMILLCRRYSCEMVSCRGARCVCKLHITSPHS